MLAMLMRQNSAKPERGIETSNLNLCTISIEHGQNSAKPERGIETLNVDQRLSISAQRCQNSAKPERKGRKYSAS